MIFLIFIIFLIFFISFFSSLLETSIFSISIQKIAPLQEINQNRYNKILDIKKNSSNVITSIVILNNISNIIGSISIGMLINNLFDPIFVIIFSFFYTIFMIIFCEIFPKLLGERYSSQIIYHTIFFLIFLPTLFKPFLFIIKLIIPSYINKSLISISEKEIQALTKLGNKEGSLESEKASIIQKTLVLNNILAKDIMTPRIKIKSFDQNKKIIDIKSTLMNIHFSRIPLYEKTLDQIVGIVYKMDILNAIIAKKEHLRVKTFLKNCLFIPENKAISKLLEDLRKSRYQIAIVVNEYGGTSGILTLEDILEELVGDIRSESEQENYNDDDENYHILSEQAIIAPGYMGLEKIGKFFDIEFKNPYTKVNKFILDHFKRFPKVGEKITINSLIFTIGQTTKKTIEKIRIEKQKKNPNKKIYI